MAKSPNFTIRLDPAQRRRWERAALRAGADNLSSWLKALADAAADVVDDTEYHQRLGELMLAALGPRLAAHGEEDAA